MITLTDCSCEAKVYADGSGVDIEFCPVHWAAPELLAAAKTLLTLLDHMTTEAFSRGEERAAREASGSFTSCSIKGDRGRV
jgi:purine-nucleoside phosphorylase